MISLRAKLIPSVLLLIAVSKQSSLLNLKISSGGIYDARHKSKNTLASWNLNEKIAKDMIKIYENFRNILSYILMIGRVFLFSFSLIYFFNI